MLYCTFILYCTFAVIDQAVEKIIFMYPHKHPANHSQTIEHVFINMAKLYCQQQRNTSMKRLHAKIC